MTAGGSPDVEARGRQNSSPGSVSRVRSVTDVDRGRATPGRSRLRASTESVRHSTISDNIDAMVRFPVRRRGFADCNDLVAVLETGRRRERSPVRRGRPPGAATVTPPPNNSQYAAIANRKLKPGPASNTAMRAGIGRWSNAPADVGGIDLARRGCRGNARSRRAVRRRHNTRCDPRALPRQPTSGFPKPTEKRRTFMPVQRPTM